VSGCSQDIHGQRRQRGEVVAATASQWKSSTAAGGRSETLCVARERDWLLARLAEKSDLTLRALLMELKERGTVVSYYAL